MGHDGQQFNGHQPSVGLVNRLIGVSTLALQPIASRLQAFDTRIGRNELLGNLLYHQRCPVNKSVTNRTRQRLSALGRRTLRSAAGKIKTKRQKQRRTRAGSKK